MFKLHTQNYIRDHSETNVVKRLINLSQFSWVLYSVPRRNPFISLYDKNLITMMTRRLLRRNQKSMTNSEQNNRTILKATKRQLAHVLIICTLEKEYINALLPISIVNSISIKISTL